jgi:hypothetical protein
MGAAPVDADRLTDGLMDKDKRLLRIRESTKDMP